MAPRAEDVGPPPVRPDRRRGLLRPRACSESLERLDRPTSSGHALPRRYGGLDFPVTVSVMIVEMISRADPALMNVFGLQDIAETVDEFGSDAHGQGHLRRRRLRGGLAGRVPENSLLSHDLFEGVSPAPAGLSDIESRGIPRPLRGRLAARTVGPAGTGSCSPGSSEGNRPPLKRPSAGVPAIGRWKMFDNLRRSLSTPSLVLALIVGWTLPPANAVVWTAFVLATIMLPPLRC